MGRARRKDREKWAEASYEMLFHCRALLAFQQATDFCCPQEIKMHAVVNTGSKGVAAWDCRSGSLITSHASFSHPECCPELTSHVEHSLEDSSVRRHQHLRSLPVPGSTLHPCRWSRSTTPVCPLSPWGCGGWGSPAPAHMLSEAVWVGTAKPQWLDCLKKERE